MAVIFKFFGVETRAVGFAGLGLASVSVLVKTGGDIGRRSSNVLLELGDTVPGCLGVLVRWPEHCLLHRERLVAIMGPSTPSDRDPKGRLRSVRYTLYRNRATITKYAV